MTEVSFHHHVPNRMTHACRLVRKAVGSGIKVVVTGDAGVLRQFDRELWTFGQLEFIPHAYTQTGTEPEAVRSPVVLSPSPTVAMHQQMLINLGGPIPDGFERFEKLIEVVTEEQDDAQSARRRYKHYADRGYAIENHNLAPKGGN